MTETNWAMVAAYASSSDRSTRHAAEELIWRDANEEDESCSA